MADGDFLYLQDQLALLVGAESVSQLPDSEQAMIRDFINESYHECYAPVDGLRPGWTMRNFAAQLPAPLEAQVTVTEGGTVVTCPDYIAADPNMDYAGSYVEIGGTHYTRVGVVNATDISVLEPIQASDGTHTAKFYFNSVRIDAHAIDLAGRPELVGDGLLSPMAGKENELTYRSLITGDFLADTGLGNGRTVNFNSTGIAFEVGRPLFYFIDQSTFGDGVYLRFVVYPLPDIPRLLRFRGNVVPAPLVDDTDLPLLPPETVKSILLPMARYAYAASTRRYTGDNRSFLREKAGKAETRLRSFAKAQKHIKQPIKVRKGYA